MTPLVAGILPIVGQRLQLPWIEWTFVSVSIGTSATVLMTGCVRLHRCRLALAPFLAGAAVLVAARLAEDAYPDLTRVGVAAGALLVIAAHVLNIRLCRRTSHTRCARLDVARPILAPDVGRIGQ